MKGRGGRWREGAERRGGKGRNCMFTSAMRDTLRSSPSIFKRFFSSMLFIR